MTNHPNRTRGPYTVEIGGTTWAQGPKVALPSMRASLTFVQSYGNTADWADVTDRHGTRVCGYRRIDDAWRKVD